VIIRYPGGRGGVVFMKGNTSWADEWEFVLKKGSVLSKVGNTKVDDSGNWIFEVIR
jgi:hypothetical protein